MKGKGHRKIREIEIRVRIILERELLVTLADNVPDVGEDARVDQ